MAEGGRVAWYGSTEFRGKARLWRRYPAGKEAKDVAASVRRKFNKRTLAVWPSTRHTCTGVAIDLETTIVIPLRIKEEREESEGCVGRETFRSRDENSQLQWNEEGAEKCDTRRVFKTR